MKPTIMMQWALVGAAAAVAAMLCCGCGGGSGPATEIKVPTVKIASKSGDVRMPMMAFGTAGTSFHGECTVQAAVEQWLKLGGRHIDTADDYGTQPDVGRALKASGVPRKDVFITTKIPGPIGTSATRDKILNTALPQLGIDYIDLVLIHFPCAVPNMTGCGKEQVAERLDTWSALSQLRSEGKIRALGVSNYNTEQVMEIKTKFDEVPAVNQVQYHLGYYNETLRQEMKDVGTYLEAWAPLGGPTVHGRTPTIPLSDPRLKEIGDRYNMSPVQVVIRWETQKGVVPVTATCTQEHIISDAGSFAFDLSAADMKTLDALMPSQHIIV